jgi:hypothetical protein
VEMEEGPWLMKEECKARCVCCANGSEGKGRDRETLELAFGLAEKW